MSLFELVNETFEVVGPLGSNPPALSQSSCGGTPTTAKPPEPGPRPPIRSARLAAFLAKENLRSVHDFNQDGKTALHVSVLKSKARCPQKHLPTYLLTGLTIAST